MRRALSAALLVLPIAAGSAFLTHSRRQADDRARAGLPPWSSASKQPPRTAKPAFPPRCVFELLMRRRGRAVDAAKPLPPILLESRTPLSRFQDAVEVQWGGRPDVFANAYSLKTGEIFLIDEADYYERLRRTIDDSLAHELVHYVQVVYEGSDLMNDPFGSYEQDAVDAQTWFRTEVFPKGPSACSNDGVRP